MLKVKMVPLSGMAIVVALSVGCAKAGTEQGSNEAINKISSEPIELSFLPSYSTTDAQIETYIKEPLKKKFPNITLNVVKTGKGVTLDTMILANQVPDIFAGAYKDTEVYVTKDLPVDLNPFIKNHKIDINRIEPMAVNTIKGFASNGELFGIPYVTHYAALFYNKDIFDKFAVPYPTDGLTWDETIAIARKLTRSDNGINYIGLDPSSPMAVDVAVGVPVGTGDIGQLNTDGWKQIFTMLKEVYEIPGFVQGKKYQYGTTGFLKDRNLAMFSSFETDVFGTLNDLYVKGDPLNWDMVTMPNFKERLGKGTDAASHVFYISKNSKYKEEAFQVIKMMISDEIQGLMNRSGDLTVLPKTDQMKQEYGTNLPFLKGKNTAAAFKMTPTEAVTHKYYSILKNELQKAAGFVALKEKDVNTALKDADEAANKLIISSGQK